MCDFVWESIKSGEVGAFNQYFENENTNFFLHFNKKRVKIHGKIFDIIGTYLKYEKEEYEDRYEKQYEKNILIRESRSLKKKKKSLPTKNFRLPISKQIQQVKNDNLSMAFDANSLYAPAMSHIDWEYPKTATGLVYLTNMNEELVNKFGRKNWSSKKI